MKTSGTIRIGIAVAVILGTIAWLGLSGYSANKSYFVKVSELGGMGDKAYSSHLRLDGFVVPGSITHDGPNADFVINEFESHTPKAATGRQIRISYKGKEPPPDTFKDDSEAVAEGTLGRDGVFHATGLQAKCASKYAPAEQNGQPAGKSAAANAAATATPAS